MYQPKLICMGIIAAPLEDVCSAVQLQLERTIGRDAFNSKLQKAIWREFFRNDGQFYDIMRAEIVLFSPRQGITAYACNLADGWLSLYENHVKARTFDAYFFRATLAEHAEYKVFEMISWRHGIRVRQVRALQEEDGWQFLNKGDPLPFEDLERYKKHQVSARMNRKLIESYSAEAGYQINSVTEFAGQCWRFWKGD